MIVIYQNNQITAVDKKLLQILNCSLTDLSEKISQVDLALNSIQNSQITIENQIFNVKEVEIVSIKNFHIYNLQNSEEINTLENNFNLPITEEIKIENPIKKPSLEEMFSSDINIISPVSKENKNKETSEEIKIKGISENILPEIIPTTKSEFQELKVEPEGISITFEDEFKEIEAILSLNSEEAKKLILQDLQKAANDFEMDLESIINLYMDLINQIETNKNNFYNAINSKDYETIHKIAHSLKGASLNLRLSNIALILKTIDEKSKEKVSFDKLEFLVNNFYAFVDKINNLDSKIGNLNENEMPEYLKQLILDTIKDYLSIQDEKKLKKDLKYIEKLLNIKINSIEELQEIIKAEK